MSREERKLRKHVEEHRSRELKKELSRQHKANTPKSKPPRARWNPYADFADDEEIAGPPPHKKQAPARQDLAAGLVVETGAGFCDVLTGETRLRCRSDMDLAPGDRVLIAPEKRKVAQRLPRRTALARTDPHNPRIERVIAANIDIVVNVVSLKNPPLRPGLIDRYLIAIGKSGADPLLCVNKIDLLENESELDALAPYHDLGIPVILCSAATGAGMELLAAALVARTCVLSGHSGVGKSSLLNALDPDLDLATGEVSQARGKGRHTTTGSSLHRLSNGATIIDTPGIREFGLWNVSAQDVRGHFSDLAAYAARCAFSDCSHSHERDCAVKQALEAGLLAEPRYRAYRRIVESLG